MDGLQGAIDELLSSGFDRAELSLLASERAVEVTFGLAALRRIELEDNPATPQGVYVSPDAIGTAEGSLIGGLAYLGAVATAGVVALAGGPLTAIIVGSLLAGGAGGILGTGLAELVGCRRASYFQEQLDRGGLLLWVRTCDAHRENRAVEILRRHSGADVHVHDFPSTTASQPRMGSEGRGLTQFRDVPDSVVSRDVV